jgi:hypothetical protein
VRGESLFVIFIVNIVIFVFSAYPLETVRVTGLKPVAASARPGLHG